MSKEMRYLLIDDCRHFGVDCIALNYQEGIRQLQLNGPWDVVYLDHDLASYVDGVEKTGYDIMCWLEENPEYLPGKIECCSSNPVGKGRINVVINRLYKNE